MSNLISDRVAFFLKEYPPFSFLSDTEMEDISTSLTIKYFNKDSVLFNEEDENKGFVFVLRKGGVLLNKRTEEGQRLVDHCEPGDIFGVRSALSGNNYQMSALSDRESLVYAIGLDHFKKLLDTNNRFSLFFASGYAAGQIIAGKDRKIESPPISDSLTDELLSYSSDVLTCSVEHSIKEIAELMSNRKVGSIIVVDSKGHPLGIITDTDLRNKVVAKDLPVSASATSIMSGPVVTAKKNLTLTEAQITMMKSGIHHLVITDNGTSNSKVCGITSDHDILISGQNHPAALIKQIKNSNEPGEWKNLRDKAEILLKGLIEQGAATSLMTALMTSINDAIIDKAIQFAIDKYPAAKEIDFCWLSLGSEGREEQLLRTDQDNAIVFRSGGEKETEAEVLLKVGKVVVDQLVHCGFERCPAKIMASNPDYCKSLEDWKKYFSKWIYSPDPSALMNSTIFFDFREVHDNSGIANELRNHILIEIKSNKIFLNFLAQNSLQNPPPLSFFNRFLVENSGEHKDEFDIKKRAMMPLSDAARLLMLESGNASIQSTQKRFEYLAATDIKNKKLYEECSEAYATCLLFRTKSGLENKDSGRFIEVSSISKLNKQILKNAFLTIKEIQELIEVRFQLAYFS